MTVKNKSTEEKILDAAHDVFIEKGMDGARTLEIAERAGINKALLHYYFRTKDMLFLAVFRKVMSNIIPKITDLFNSELSFFELIEKFVERYLALIMKNPFLPGFIFHEIQRNPDKLANVIKEGGIRPDLFINLVNKAIKDRQIRPVDPMHLIINIFGLCLFPVIGRPMMQRIFFDNDSMAYKNFLKERTKEVSEFIINSIKLK